MTAVPKKSSVVLWVSAPLLLWLSCTRPPHARSERASQMPAVIGGFRRVEDRLQIPAGATAERRARLLKKRRDIWRLLGTNDVSWWAMQDGAGNFVFLTAVFHETNWKSLHPPHMCIRGSDFSIRSDESRALEVAPGRTETVGRLLATEEEPPRRDYVSLYAFVGRDFVTPSYTSFYLQHAPRALLRRATSGFLVRVEAFVGADGLAATEARCAKLLRAFLPVGEGLIRD